jgi:hypothetical protein
MEKKERRKTKDEKLDKLIIRSQSIKGIIAMTLKTNRESRGIRKVFRFVSSV